MYPILLEGASRQRYLAMGGQIFNASIVPVAKQRDSRDYNAKIKAGEACEDCERQPAKRAQKDTDDRWTKRHGRSHFGYKNHVDVDRRHELIRRDHAMPAPVHDSQTIDGLLEIEAKVAEQGMKSRIHRRRSRGRPFGGREQEGNRTRFRLRARVEHVFCAQPNNDMGATLVRRIGLVRAKAWIGLKRLACNVRRLVQLECITTAAPG